MRGWMSHGFGAAHSDGLGITALRLTGQARVGEERIDIGERPGSYGMHSLYLRTVIAPTAPSTINAFIRRCASARFVRWRCGA
jgi:hypothetical protein